MHSLEELTQLHANLHLKLNVTPYDAPERKQLLLDIYRVQCSICSAPITDKASAALKLYCLDQMLSWLDMGMSEQVRYYLKHMSEASKSLIRFMQGQLN